jgi:hypothetical protein
MRRFVASRGIEPVVDSPKSARLGEDVRQVRIHIDVDATGHYVFRVRSGTGEITGSVNPDLAASFFEDLRLLRWKSAGVHDQGDILLNHVGDRLAGLIATPATWERSRPTVTPPRKNGS